jgi:excisionase family DNA binding protein
MLADEKKLQNIRVRMVEGTIYTVDEVSGLLGIPRPTLYRYLREYSIPHLRRAGRISIPEDSFDRIKEARDLHKEGLSTESVRRQLREGSASDAGDLDRRLDSLHQSLEGLQRDVREHPVAEEVALSPTLQTILARQSLIMSAMFNLTEMVEDLLLASGKPRRPIFDNLATREAMPEPPARGRLEIPGQVPVGTTTLPGADQDIVGQTLAARSADFGALRKRRRRAVLAILAALLFAVSLAWSIQALFYASNAEPLVPRLSAMADEPPGDPKAVASDSGLVRETEVPDVSGQSLEVAVRSISNAGFEVADIRTEASRRAPQTAIRTQPTAGTPTKQGAPIILTMSAGPTVAPTATPTASAR